VHDLAAGRAHDYISDSVVEVPKVDIWIAGFSCKGWSSLNQDRESVGSLIAGNKGSSGESANGCLAAIAQLKPPIIIMENVKQIASASAADDSSDLDFLRTQLARLGYRIAVFRLRAETFGSPCNRDRLYIVGTLDPADGPGSVLAAAVANVEVDKAVQNLPQPDWEAPMRMLLEAMMMPDQYPVEQFLLPDDHPEVIRCLQESTKPPPAKAPPAKKARPAAKSTPAPQAAAEKEPQDFQIKNYQYFMNAGLPWPPTLADNPKLASALAYLPERQRQAAILHGHYVAKIEGCREIIVDLHPSIDFGSHLYTTPCHTLVCSSRPFLVRRTRDVCGFRPKANLYDRERLLFTVTPCVSPLFGLQTV
jgi:site-specific DNA-cytosine methylase